MGFDKISRKWRRLGLSLAANAEYFPWRTASRALLLQLAGFTVGLVVTGYTLRYHAISLFETASVSPIGTSVDQFVRTFDEKLSWLFAASLIASIAWFSFVTYLGLRPMARVLRMMKRRGPRRSFEEDDDAFIDEPGEWQDLEKSVESLSRGLRQREALLVREREELVTILGSVNEAIVAMGKETEPLYFNSRFAVLFGAGATGGSALPLRERFRLPELLTAFDRVLSEKTTRTFRVKLRTELHESEREFSVAVSPLTSRPTSSDDRGEVYGAVAIFHDITELKASEQIRIDFVANASHELKTPLTSIKGYVDTVRDDLKNSRTDDAVGFLDVVSRNVDRLILLVNDLLDLSVLESGAEVRKSLVSTAEVSEQALRLMEGRRSKRHTVRLEIKTDRVLGDATRIEQVLVNLIDNATKYSPDGTEIRISWEQGTGANLGDTVLIVRDTGPGIPEEHLPRLFERFYRVDAGRAREVGGTGLGLAIVKHIVLAHGGSIAVKSRPGDGAEFICRFPSRA